MQTNVYVDGFNLYYGAVKGTPFRWLDLGKLSAGLLKRGHEIHRIRYFTAPVAGTASDPTAPERQAIYLRALRTLPDLSIHQGRFLTNRKTLPRADGSGMVDVIVAEEKGSDVNLGALLLLDAFDQDYEVALVISNDTDLLFPIREARRRFGVTVGVSCPVYPKNRHPNRQLVEAADFNTHITRKRKKLLRESQFSNPLSDADGTFHKPVGW